jgi:Zn-finger nucleic acid-binding protein
MQCPVDAATLLMTERQGVEIDYCPQCRGVWLDRGELDKLLQRADDDRDDDDHRDRRSIRDGRDSYPPKKKKRWLSEMFEFD